MQPWWWVGKCSPTSEHQPKLHCIPTQAMRKGILHFILVCKAAYIDDDLLPLCATVVDTLGVCASDPKLICLKVPDNRVFSKCTRMAIIPLLASEALLRENKKGQ